MFRNIAAAAAAVGLLASAPAHAATPEATFNLQITGFVPTVCNAQLSTSTAPSQAGTVSLGDMSEFCNNANGYQVWVDYSPTLAGDTLQVGDQTITLTSSGSALIDASSTPNISTKSVSLNVPQSGVSGYVSVRMVTL